MFQRVTQAPIRLRLPAMIVCALMACFIAMSAISYIDFRNGVKEHVKELSETVAKRSIDSAQSWAATLVSELNWLAEYRPSIDLLERLNTISGSSNAPTLGELRDGYINENPFPLGERQQLNRSTNAPTYDFAHAEFHELFRGITNRSGYYDLFFISSNGDVLYSVFKEDDFATNLQNGIYAESGLAQAFRGAIAAPSGQVSFSDFAPYAPSANAPASFIAEKITNATGETIGVVAIQLPINSLKSSLEGSNILGPNDEVYLLGNDGLARTESVEPGLLSILQELPPLSHLTYEKENGAVHFDDTLGLRGTHVDAHVNNFDMLGTTWFTVVERDLDAAYSQVSDFFWHIVIILGFGVLFSTAIGFFLARSVTRPLADFSTSMRRIANGDLDTKITTLDRADEFGQVASDLNAFREKLAEAKVVSENEAHKSEEQAEVVKILGDGLKQLANGNLADSLDTPFSEEYEELRHNFNATLETMNDLMRTIVENSNEIHARAEEISASSDDLSHRTENQAATLEETAAALSELTASVREASESASEVENVVTEARQDAEESGLVVSEAVEAMSMIRKSSSEISQIIGVIDDIAFQTNLLSLNAGVEAARAGDAGRGFAVVASEVRALAQRSSEAAKQIKSLITSSSEQVETGVELVGRTGEALGSIINKVSNIDTLVSGIASGSREQSSGLGEINIGMSQLDQVTQQNAAMVEEATAAATTLRTEAAGLTHTVARFKLKNIDVLTPNMDGVIEFQPSRAGTVNGFKDQPSPDRSSQLKAVSSNNWTDF